MKYLIIDDEPIAHKLIQNFAAEISYMELVGNCYNAIDALPILKEENVDLIFLDIQMPKLRGFDLIRSLKNPPLIIVISAHEEYALEGYEYNIVDYLLKPFNFERFFKSVQKAFALTSNPEKGISNKEDSIFIKDEKKHHKVKLDDILYIEASGNYAIVYLKKDRIISQMKISDFENLLVKNGFTRIHRSFLVSNKHITLLKASEIHIGDHIIPVGRVYKENLQSILSK